MNLVEKFINSCRIAFYRNQITQHISDEINTGFHSIGEVTD